MWHVLQSWAATGTRSSIAVIMFTPQAFTASHRLDTTHIWTRREGSSRLAGDVGAAAGRMLNSPEAASPQR